MSNQIVHQLETDHRFYDFALADKLDACSRQLWIVKRAGVLEIHPSLCRNRVCPICSYYRALKLRERLETRYKQMRNPKLLTLTMAASELPLDKLICRLLKAFTSLRRRAVFAAACKSGTWVIEWTLSTHTGCWHVHLHVLLDATYLPQAWLSDTWRKITKDSYIVDIRRADARAPAYLAKYLAKQGQELPPLAKLPEWLAQTKGSRAYGSFGAKPLPEPEKLLEPDYERVCSLDILLINARCGHPDALLLLAQICERYGVPFPGDLPPPSG